MNRYGRYFLLFVCVLLVLLVPENKSDLKTDSVIISREKGFLNHSVEKSNVLYTETTGEFTKENKPIYRTKGGECYHTEDCYYLKTKIQISLDDAIKRGLRPCSRCNPPKNE